MPATPGWHAHLPTLRRTLAAMTATPWLDRPAIERLFGLRARQANYLMRTLPGRRLGTSVVIDRDALLAHLDTLAEPRGLAAAPTQRKASVLEAIQELRAAPRPRAIAPVLPAPPPPGAKGTSLPSGVQLTAPGELTLAFASPEQLLGQILALAQAASAHFAGFAQSLEFVAPERQGEAGVSEEAGGDVR